MPDTPCLETLRDSALQLECLLEALNAMAGDDRRREMSVGLIESAMEIARELVIGLDIS